jgi:hypothetical protein
LPCLASPINFQIDPIVVETTAVPGVPQTGVINITNNNTPVPVVTPAAAGATSATPANPSATPPPSASTTDAATPAPDSAGSIRVRLYTVDWTLERNGNPVFQDANTLPDSCASWIQFNPIELDINAGQTISIRYTVSVPPTAQGDYRCMLMFETVPNPSPVKRKTMFVAGRIGCAIYVQVGPESKRLRITALQATPQNVVVTVEDTGTTHVRLAGTVRFEDAGGTLVGQEKLTGGVLLPGENNERDLTVQTPALRPGTYTVTAILDYGAESLLGARSHVTIP